MALPTRSAYSIPATSLVFPCWWWTITHWWLKSGSPLQSISMSHTSVPIEGKKATPHVLLPYDIESPKNSHVTTWHLDLARFKSSIGQPSSQLDIRETSNGPCNTETENWSHPSKRTKTNEQKRRHLVRNSDCDNGWQVGWVCEAYRARTPKTSDVRTRRFCKELFAAIFLPVQSLR